MAAKRTLRKREGIAATAHDPRRSPFRARLAAPTQATETPAAFPPARRRSARFDSPGFRWDKEWRKREGIEPTGDISASRPDLKSGGATSAPSASVVEGSPVQRAGGERHFGAAVSLRRCFRAFAFRCLRRRISRLRSVVMVTPFRGRLVAAGSL